MCDRCRARNLAVWHSRPNQTYGRLLTGGGTSIDLCRGCRDDVRLLARELFAPTRHDLAEKLRRDASRLSAAQPVVTPPPPQHSVSLAAPSSAHPSLPSTLPFSTDESADVAAWLRAFSPNQSSPPSSSPPPPPSHQQPNNQYAWPSVAPQAPEPAPPSPWSWPPLHGNQTSPTAIPFPRVFPNQQQRPQQLQQRPPSPWNFAEASPSTPFVGGSYGHSPSPSPLSAIASAPSSAPSSWQFPVSAFPRSTLATTPSHAVAPAPSSRRRFIIPSTDPSRRTPSSGGGGGGGGSSDAVPLSWGHRPFSSQLSFAPHPLDRESSW